MKRKDEALVKEVIERMVKGEKGLHTKLIEPYKVVRMTKIPTLLKNSVNWDLKHKKFEVKKKINYKGHTILLLKRPL